MRLRASILLIFATVLLVQQLPIEPVMWGEETACCALAQYCPMSAKPQEGMRAGDSCDMKNAAACSIRAACSTGRHRSDGTLSPSALARPAVLDGAESTIELALDSSLVTSSSRVASASGAEPPEPPPRPLFA